MQIHIPYGKNDLELEIPEGYTVDIISPNRVPAAADPISEVQTALENLIGEVSWARFQHSGSVGVAINDRSRPVPLESLLPPLLEHLAALGVREQAITLYVASGSHPPMGPGEFKDILPSAILDRYRVVSHDANDRASLLYLGETNSGTPVYANAEFMQTEHRIVVGNIEPHQFAGFSGGVKTAAIGLAGVETISRNHAMLSLPDARIGVYETNPVRQDIEEIGEMMAIDLSLNAVLNLEKKIVTVLAGQPKMVMEHGIPISRQICQVPVPHRYNLVIVSPGGFPKDINLYQAQKALAHAAPITRPGGTIFLAAACSQGSGSPTYEAWMEGKTSYQQVIESFKTEGFQVGPHKAFLIARESVNFNLLVYCELEDNQARDLLLNPIEDLQVEINTILKGFPTSEHIGFLPYASSTIPYLTRKAD
jgi:nickel-dependent lactate racemase